MLYIVVTQIDASLKEDVLKHKKDVDLKDVYNTKKCVCHRNLLITRNTKKCVCLEDNRSWLKDARKEKRCWVISESSLSQIWVRSRLDYWLVLINSDTFVTQTYFDKFHFSIINSQLHYWLFSKHLFNKLLVMRFFTEWWWEWWWWRWWWCAWQWWFWTAW